MAAPNGSADRIWIRYAHLLHAPQATVAHRYALVDAPRAECRAEFVLAQSSRNVWVRVGKYIRIHAQREACLALELASPRPPAG